LAGFVAPDDFLLGLLRRSWSSPGTRQGTRSAGQFLPVAANEIDLNLW